MDGYNRRGYTASTTWGITAGLTMSKWAVSGDEIFNDQESRRGFGGGIFFEKSLQVPGISVKTEILYLMKGSHEDGYDSFYDVDYDYDYNMSTLSITPLLLLGLTETPQFTMFVELGPEFGFIIKKSISYKEDNLSGEEDMENVTDTEFGLNVGLGFTLDNSVTLDIRYSIGLTNIYSGDIDVSIKSRSLQIFLSLSFPQY